MKIRGTEYLTGVRGFAALIVVFGHCSNTGMHLAGADLSETAKIGVWLFFILSAYLLTPKLLQAVEGKGWAPAVAEYAVKRFARILPMYYAVLAALALAGKMAPGTALEHMALMRGDMHFWTIPVEMAFYAILPLMVWGMVAMRPGVAAVVFLVVATAFYFVANPHHIEANTLNLANYFVFFAAGSALSLARPARLSPLPADAIVLLALAMIPLLAPRTIENLNGGAGLAWSILFIGPWTVLIWAGQSSRLAQILFANRAMQYVGTVSFGLYLVHYFVIPAVQRLSLNPMLSGWIVLGVSLAIAALAYHWFERPCEMWGKRWRYGHLPFLRQQPGDPDAPPRSPGQIPRAASAVIEADHGGIGR